MLVNQSQNGFIHSYLTSRTQSVRVGSSISTPLTVPCGVPQGSHLGPFLFALFVNDLIDIVEQHGVHCSVYADDVKLYFPIRNYNDHLKLQAALTAIDDWCQGNGMILNAAKCVSITFGWCHNQTQFQYAVRGTTITRSNCVKDLGIWLDTKLKMNIHIDKATSSARRVLGLAKRFCKELGDDVWTARSLYLTLVRPIIEYASVAWSPTHTTKIALIESVQKQFLIWALRKKYPDFLNLPPYRSRLDEIRIDSIEHRHQLASVLFAYDALNGKINCPDIVSRFTRNRSTRDTRRRRFFSTEQHTTDYARDNPINLAMTRFNPVATLARSCRSRRSFRAAVLQSFTRNLIENRQ